MGVVEDVESREGKATQQHQQKADTPSGVGLLVQRRAGFYRMAAQHAVSHKIFPLIKIDRSYVHYSTVS